MSASSRAIPWPHSARARLCQNARTEVRQRLPACGRVAHAASVMRSRSRNDKPLDGTLGFPEPSIAAPLTWPSDREGVRFDQGSADDLIMAHQQYGIDLVGPARPDQSWQGRAEAAFSAADFAVDWDRRVARCPEGQESTGWFESAQRPGQRSSIRARFRAADCRACASRTRCTRARLGRHGRGLALLPKREYQALAAARAREGTAEGRRLSAQRKA